MMWSHCFFAPSHPTLRNQPILRPNLIFWRWRQRKITLRFYSNKSTQHPLNTDHKESQRLSSITFSQRTLRPAPQHTKPEMWLGQLAEPSYRSDWEFLSEALLALSPSPKHTRPSFVIDGFVSHGSRNVKISWCLKELLQNHTCGFLRKGCVTLR